MKLGNESPIGLATILAALPGIAAVVVLAVAFILNGYDIDRAVAATTAIIGAASLVFTGGMRQWRAAKPADDRVTGEELVGGTPLPTGADGESL